MLRGDTGQPGQNGLVQLVGRIKRIEADIRHLRTRQEPQVALPAPLGGKHLVAPLSQWRGVLFGSSISAGRLFVRVLCDQQAPAPWELRLVVDGHPGNPLPADTSVVFTAPLAASGTQRQVPYSVEAHYTDGAADAPDGRPTSVDPTIEDPGPLVAPEVTRAYGTLSSVEAETSDPDDGAEAIVAVYDHATGKHVDDVYVVDGVASCQSQLSGSYDLRVSQTKFGQYGPIATAADNPVQFTRQDGYYITLKAPLTVSPSVAGSVITVAFDTDQPNLSRANNEQFSSYRAYARNYRTGETTSVTDDHSPIVLPAVPDGYYDVRVDALGTQGSGGVRQHPSAPIAPVLVGDASSGPAPLGITALESRVEPA